MHGMLSNQDAVILHGNDKLIYFEICYLIVCRNLSFLVTTFIRNRPKKSKKRKFISSSGRIAKNKSFGQKVN